MIACRPVVDCLDNAGQKFLLFSSGNHPDSRRLLESFNTSIFAPCKNLGIVRTIEVNAPFFRIPQSQFY